MDADAGEQRTAETQRRLDYLRRALAARQAEAAWRAYLAVQDKVPVTYRVEMAILLQRATQSTADAALRAERLCHILVSWPAIQAPPAGAPSEAMEMAQAEIRAQRRCLDAYLAVENRVDQVRHAVTVFLGRQERGWRDGRIDALLDASPTEMARRPSLWTLSSLMRVYALQAMPAACRAWMLRMQHAYGLYANNACWHWMVVAWLRAGRPREAVGVVTREMPRAGVRVLARSWMVLLRTLAADLTRPSKYLGAAWQTDLRQCQLAADALLRYLEKHYCGPMDDWMLQKGVDGAPVPDASADAAMKLQPHLDVGRYGLNERVFASAAVLALKLRRNTMAERLRACCNAIHGRASMDSSILLRKEVEHWCSAGKYDKAVAAAERLPPERRHQPYVVSILMTAARRAGRPDEAVAHFEHARDSGLCAPNAYMWTALIAAHAERMDLTAAQQAFDDMLQAGEQPGVAGYTALLVAYGKCGLLENAEATIRRMQENRSENQPNQKTWCALADAYAKAGEIDRVIAMLLQHNRTPAASDANHDGAASTSCSDSGSRSLDMISINTVMAALNRAGRPRDVLHLWRAAFDAGRGGDDAPLRHRRPDDTLERRSWNFATLCIVLDTCAWHQLPAEGERVWREATRGLLDLPTAPSDTSMVAVDPLFTSTSGMATAAAADAKLDHADSANAAASSTPATHRKFRGDGKQPMRDRLSRRCWYSYVGLLGRTGRVHEIPAVIECMIGLGRIPHKPLLLHAFAFLMDAGAEDEVMRIGRMVSGVRQLVSAPGNLLPTEAEIAAYYRNRG
ncbi:hypothetical protein THASP1DRAFT_22938 [Thamnocephalis sphaerospora]|uniref:Pentacotripeptide-repeat region of PRORP domain-containing protein n=1 Tax=Thamnocephalis sphaerospora TaxID=78915 RepID=A0A4P9XT71_9FUNG|nr:hypothetical protein THASP1DRAFT_22938 [Thamnocephalis sphaerospora]|eukprot:RKP09192.1 hypothetical protein THASP1DRAFT_22938 [Thamnocephalis sphaerospora]